MSKMTEEQTSKIEWLNRARYTRNALCALERLKVQKRSMATACGINYENDGTQNGGGKNGTEIKFLNLAEVEERIETAKKDLYDVHNEIERAIYSIDNIELRTVMINHYLNFMSWEETAEDMKYSVRAIKYKHVLALDELKIS